MPIIPPGYAELSIPHRHSDLARPALVTMGLAISDVPDPSDVNAIVQTYWDEFFQVVGDSDVAIGPGTVRVGQDGGDSLAVLGTVTHTGATGTSAAVNVGQALLVHKHTARGGRRGRGRMFIPWVLEEINVNDVGVLATSTVTGMNSLLALWKTAAEALAWVDSFVLLHGAGESVPGLPNAILSLSADSMVGSQRRRLGR